MNTKMKFKIPDGNIDIPEDTDEQLDELAYDEAEKIVALSKKEGQCWPIERLIADSLKHGYTELCVLRGNKEFNSLKRITINLLMIMLGVCLGWAANYFYYGTPVLLGLLGCCILAIWSPDTSHLEPM